MTVAFAGHRLGSEAISGTFARAAPSATITAPGLSVVTAPTVTWAYTSPVSRAQAFYRVRLQSSSGAITLFDSGIQSGAGTSYTPAYAYSDLSTYKVVVDVADIFDWSADATSSFTYYASTASSYPDAAVGSIYEIGINGQGYMLADNPADQEMRYRRQTVPLDSPRFSTGDTPFSEAVDRYTFVGWSDWRSGAGQRYRNRTDSDSAAFYDSEGVNPFEPGGLQLLNATASTLVTSYANPLAVVASNKLYVLTGAKQITEVATVGGSTTAFSVAAGTTFTSMASDGTNWYAADGANIFRNSSAADPGAAWSTLDAQVMAWAGDRLCIGYATAPATTPNTFSTLANAGTEEVGGGRLILQGAATITSIVGGNGYVWFAVKRGQQGLVYAWKAGTTDAPFIAFEFPAGQYPVSLGFYLSNVFIRTSEPLSAGGARANIYRAATSDGKLVPAVIAQIESGTDDHTTGAWAGNSRFALFSWKKMTAAGTSGVGAIDLSSGGYARWLYAPSVVSGDVTSVVSWNGRAVFSVAGSGVYAEGTTPLSTGNLRTDFADLGTSIAKVLGELRVETSPLPASASVVLEYSLDAGSSYAPITYTLTGAGLQTLTGSLDRQAASVGLRITLNASGTSPIVRTVAVRLHPYGLADQVIILPINCGDRVDGMNGQELPESGAGNGSRRARTLEDLIQTRVKFQDIDWDVSNPVSTIWEVQSVDVRSTGVFGRSQNRPVSSQVAIVTMRRTAK